MVRVILAASVCLVLAGCGGIGSSAFNPMNWFRSGGEEATEALVPAEALQRRDSRPLVEEVTDLVVERVPGGAIVRARARVAATGWYGAALVPEPERSGPGVLAYTFRAQEPAVPVPQAGPASRRLVAATFVSDQELLGIRQIQVASRSNIRTARR